MPLVPVPPGSGLDPRIETWRAGRQVWRCHEPRLGPREFNPGLGQGRFHPLHDLVSGAPIGTLYGSDQVSGALSESVFRSVPVRGPGKLIRRSALGSVRLSALVPSRDLLLADFSGSGLRRIGVHRSELIDCPAMHYGDTARWAEAIHRDAAVDGLLWVSRQDDTALAIVLFGDRVDPADLDVLVESLPLDRGPGWNYVLRSAEDADIMIVL